ncbi:MAG: hypothetical protein DMG26_17625 [Acidobacteria bacterium]|nr:MAG: hypothetical protein DMG26_17625 [Acidobacteriota bacterium]
MSVTRRSFLGAMTAAAGRRVLGANDRVQVGFIGYGLIGAQHVYDFKSQHDVDLAALCDVYQPRLEEGLAACGPTAKGYRDFRRLLDDRDIQAVVISTPDHLRGRQGRVRRKAADRFRSRGTVDGGRRAAL